MLPTSAHDAAQGARRGPRMGRGKVVAITLGAALVFLVGVYVAGAIVFTSRFYPHTVLGQLDVSFKTADEAASLLSEVERDYVLHVKAPGVDFSISSKEAGVGVDAHAIVREALADADPWAWPLRIAGVHDETERLAATSDTDSLSEAVHAALDPFNASASPSEDAAVVFDGSEGAYTVKAEVYGTQIDVDKVVEQAAAAMADMQAELNLESDVLIRPSVLSDDPRLAAAADKANTMVACDVVLKASNTGIKVGELDGSVISQWVSFGDDLEPVLDESAMKAWADDLASSLNTVRSVRSYTRPDGKKVEINGGDYGWAVDSDTLAASLKEAVYNGTVGEVGIPFAATGNGYTAPGQDWGAYCDVDLSEQHAYYYDASGNLLWDAGIVSGKPDGQNDTPTGVYYLKNLQQHVSLKGPVDPETNKPEWDSPVDYWMPFVGNMVGLHDAPWQAASVFGDASAYKTVGSHGCVNLSADKAAALFGIIQIGDPVIVHW